MNFCFISLNSLGSNLFLQKIIVFLCVLLPSFALRPSMIKCPNNKVGYFPKCDCEGENYGYSNRDRECRLMCPSISDGVFPNCTCRYGGAYNNMTNTCPNPSCPKNTTADSVYPNCECTGRNYKYNEYLNECYLVCPEDSSGYFPNCRCKDKFKGFNKGKGPNQVFLNQTLDFKKNSN